MCKCEDNIKVRLNREDKHRTHSEEGELGFLIKVTTPLTPRGKVITEKSKVIQQILSVVY